MKEFIERLKITYRPIFEKAIEYEQISLTEMIIKCDDGSVYLYETLGDTIRSMPEDSNMNKDNIPSGVKGIHHGINTASTSKITNKFNLITNAKVKNTTNILNNKMPKHSDENGEYFDYADEKPIELSKNEKEVFGNREMKGYSKIKLLGK